MKLGEPSSRWWTVKLRKDVHFHDGKPLTSADVVYSLLRHKDPKVGSIAKTLAAQIQEVKATGPTEVQITIAGAGWLDAVPQSINGTDTTAFPFVAFWAPLGLGAR